jgi:hypothetical protein
MAAVVSKALQRIDVSILSQDHRPREPASGGTQCLQAQVMDWIVDQGQPLHPRLSTDLCRFGRR